MMGLLAKYARYFIETYPNQSFWGRFPVSKLGRKLFGASFCNLEHWLSHYPLAKERGIFAALDFVERTEDGTYVLRGWIFDYHRPLEKVSLLINGDEAAVICKGLMRYDVRKAFPFLHNAQRSGFVYQTDKTFDQLSTSDIGFRIDSGDRSIEGLFFVAT